MVYRTIKTINGRKYLYEQKSTREAGKVVTVSNYIAPLGEVIYDTITGINGSVLLKNGTMLEPFVDEFTFDRATGKALLRAGIKPKKPIITPPNSTKKLNLTHRTVSVAITKRLQKYGISEKSIIREAERFVKIFDYLGLPTDNMPKIKIAHGSGFSFAKKTWFSKFPTLFVPAPKSRIAKIMAKPHDRRKKVNRHLPKNYKLSEKSHRDQFYAAYGKALAENYLTHLANTDKERFSRLEQAFKSSFKQKNRSISLYLKGSPKPTTSHYYFNLTGSLTQFFQAKFKPSFFGLVDWQARKNWQDDFTALASLIQKHGYEHVSKGLGEDIQRQKRLIGSLTRKKLSLGFMERLSGSGRTIDRNINRQSHRLQAMTSTMEQINALHIPFFKLEKRGRGEF